MKNKKLLIIFVVLLINCGVIFFILNKTKSKDMEINSEENIPTSKVVEIKNDIYNKEITSSGVIVCGEDDDCFLDTFLNCSKGIKDYVDKNNKKWSFVINNKTEENCNISFVEYKDNKTESIYCIIPIEKLSKKLFEDLKEKEESRIEFCDLN